jgi:hypothetical protein
MNIKSSQTPGSNGVKRARKQIVVKKKNKALQKTPNKKLPRTPEERERIWERQNQALQMRMAGATYTEICKALGYSSPGGAKNAVESAISRTDREAAKQVVALDLARLDEYQMRCTHALRTNGDLSQIDRLMRIMEMRYRLLGINDETVRLLQQDHGIHTTTNVQNNVMVVRASPETEDEFIGKMMSAVGVNPDSKEAQKYLQNIDRTTPRALPMAPGSANSLAEEAMREAAEEIVDAEIVEE